MNYLIAGNWKMNGLKASMREITALQERLVEAPENAEVLICPPVTLLPAMAAKADKIMVGAQDCHAAESGAHTGDVSAEMLHEAGASYVIVGHSERRADHGETNKDVRAKAEAVLRAGMMPIVCVGETREEREAGEAIAIVTEQVKASLPEGDQYVIAYEPVWAIGTGLVPTIDDIAEVHDCIRGLATATTPILYGGSVKPGNAPEILAVTNVNGALVGGARLKADDLYGIISAVK